MNNTQRQDSAAAAREQFVASVARDGEQAALTRLRDRLDAEPLATWIACAPDVARLCEPSSARAWLLHALSRWPAATELRYRLAHVLWQDNEVEASERVLRDLLAVEPDHADAMYLLANIWRSQGKLLAAATSLHGWCLRFVGGVEVTLRCAQFIVRCSNNRWSWIYAPGKLRAGHATRSWLRCRQTWHGSWGISDWHARVR